MSKNATNVMMIGNSEGRCLVLGEAVGHHGAGDPPLVVTPAAGGLSLYVAGTRKGKTLSIITTLLAPNGVGWTAPVWVFDPKGDILHVTARRRGNRAVVLSDPFNSRSYLAEYGHPLPPSVGKENIDPVRVLAREGLFLELSMCFAGEGESLVPEGLAYFLESMDARHREQFGSSMSGGWLLSQIAEGCPELDILAQNGPDRDLIASRLSLSLGCFGHVEDDFCDPQKEESVVLWLKNGNIDFFWGLSPRQMQEDSETLRVYAAAMTQIPHVMTTGRTLAVLDEAARLPKPSKWLVDIIGKSRDVSTVAAYQDMNQMIYVFGDHTKTTVAMARVLLVGLNCADTHAMDIISSVNESISPAWFGETRVFFREPGRDAIQVGVQPPCWNLREDCADIGTPNPYHSAKSSFLPSQSGIVKGSGVRWTDKIAKQINRLIGQGQSVSDACRRVGVSRQTYYRRSGNSGP
ncbi:MAG: hypothetical protein VR70_10870 [Rhodospirillaceae bacterium BRH_c57]|nr:MAG: hypothetical protein VR70_10870 [Rhodospirillaceae bacterium BRH_c57]